LKIVGVKNNARVNLKIEEPEGGTHMPRFQGSEAGGPRPERPAEEQ
jgi:hypothetical protein